MKDFEIKQSYLEEDYTLLDFEGRIIILTPELFNIRFRNPFFSVAKAYAGSGCKATSLGRTVYIKYLDCTKDSKVSRADVIGVVKKELEPEFLEKFCDYRDKMQENKPKSLSLDMIEAFNKHMEKESSNIRYIKKSSDIYDSYELSVLEPFLEIYTPMKIIPPHFVEYIRNFFKNNFGVEDTGYTNTVHTVVLKNTSSQEN